MKKILCIFTVLFSFCLAASVFASETPFRINREIWETKTPLEIKNGTTMIALDDLAECFLADINPSEKGQSLRYKEITCTFAPDSAAVKVETAENKDTVTLSVLPYMRDGHLMIPLREVCSKLYNTAVEWYPADKSAGLLLKITQNISAEEAAKIQNKPVDRVLFSYSDGFCEEKVLLSGEEAKTKALRIAWLLPYLVNSANRSQCAPYAVSLKIDYKDGSNAELTLDWIDGIDFERIFSPLTEDLEVRRQVEPLLKSTVDDLERCTLSNTVMGEIELKREDNPKFFEELLPLLKAESETNPLKEWEDNYLLPNDYNGVTFTFWERDTENALFQYSINTYTNEAVTAFLREKGYDVKILPTLDKIKSVTLKKNDLTLTVQDDDLKELILNTCMSFSTYGSKIGVQIELKESNGFRSTLEGSFVEGHIPPQIEALFPAGK